jgi:hypothetical protein
VNTWYIDLDLHSAAVAASHALTNKASKEVGIRSFIIKEGSGFEVRRGREEVQNY